MMKLEKIGQIAINVKDINRANSFYQEKLGFSAIFETPTMVFMNCGTTTLMLGIPEKEEFAQGSSTIYFEVQDIQGYYEYYKNIGVNFVDMPHIVADMGSYDVWMVFFKDTEENLLALMSNVSKS